MVVAGLTAGAHIQGTAAGTRRHLHGTFIPVALHGLLATVPAALVRGGTAHWTPWHACMGLQVASVVVQILPLASWHTCACSNLKITNLPA